MKARRDDCPSDSHENLLIVIGASAGGLKEILSVIGEAPSDLSGSIVVCWHRSASEENVLARILDKNTRVQVIEAFDGEPLECAHLYVGRGQDQLTVCGSELRMRIDWRGRRRMQRIDDLFITAAEAAGSNTLGVILSGALDDGVDGLAAIKRAGGKALVQRPADADYSGMPVAAINRVDCDFIGSAREIGERLIQIASSRTCE